MVVRLLAGYRLFTTRDREKLFFDFFALKVFYVKRRRRCQRLVRDCLERFEFCVLNTG